MSLGSAGLIYPVQCLVFIKNYAIVSAGPELYVYVIPDLCVMILACNGAPLNERLCQLGRANHFETACFAERKSCNYQPRCCRRRC